MANQFQQFLLGVIDTHGGSQERLAKKLGIGQSSISRWLAETNPSRPDPEAMIELARATGIQVTTIFLLAYPEAQEVMNGGDVDGASRLAAEYFAQLPEQHRQLAVQILRAMLDNLPK